MKTIKNLIIILLFTGVNYLYAQAPVIDFETVGNDWSYGLFGQGSSTFEIVANPDPSGINTSDSVACYIVNADAMGWAGVFSGDFPDLTLDATNAIVTVMVWKDVISDFNLKLEPPNLDQRDIKNTVTGQWEMLTFDYSAYIGETVVTLTVLPDHVDTRTAGSVIYYDNITFSPVPPRLQVIHNAADIAADPVDVYLDGTLLLDDFAFREATEFIDAPAGVEINIGVAAGNSSSVEDTLKNFAVTLEDGETYVAVANGVLDPNSYAPNPDEISTAFTLFINAMARETGTSSDVDFFVVHGATDAPTVDVIARGGGTLVDDAAYSDITPYITVPPAEYTLDLTLADGTTLVQSYVADLSGLGGGSAAVFASGFLTPANNQNGEAFGLFFALADGTVGQFPAEQTARLQVIHNAADIAADPVDVYLDGALLLDDFAFREATEFIDAPAGVEINIGVAAGNSSSVEDTLKNFAVTLEDGETYVAVANGVLDPNSYAPNPDEISTAFTLFINAMARETGTSSDVDFFVVHGATDAPTVDVIARGGGTLVDDAAYSDITPYITVPPAEYTLDLTLADGTTLVQSYVADLSGLGGGSAAVFASGFLTPANNQNGEAFGLFFALADGTVGQFPIVTSVEEISSITPKTYNLSQNYPNPFNPSTNINFSLPNNEFVTLKVYNILGGEVATLVNRELTAGSYEFDFDASNLASGIYFYELKAGNFAEIRKMNLLK